MKLKSLLLGTAAAMVAVSGAQAADAVIVEPEPVEYVRVCDAYGSGFFFIPGTETCLRFNGYVRSYYSVTHAEYTDPVTGAVTADVAFTDWASRARMQVTANSETDWGTLSAFFRIDTDLRGSGNQAAQIDRGLISLAGFRAGLGAQYWVTNHGFAGVNLAGIVSDRTFQATEDGPYAGSTTASTMFDYTWAGDGLSITGGVQTLGGIARTQFTGGLHDYYIGMNYSADWGGVAFTWVNDSNAVDNLGNVGDGSAWKVSVDLDLSEFIPGGLLHGMYMTDGDDVTQYVVWAGYADASDIWQISYQMDLGDEFVLAAQYSDIEEDVTGSSAWVAGIGLNWFPAAAPGFSVYGSYSFGETDLYTGAAVVPGLVGNNVEFDQFTIRVRRDF